MYPVTVIRARYGGAYEHAKWLAFNDYPPHISDAVADDGTCDVFFNGGQADGVPLPPYPGPIGRGDTPEQAYEDLLSKGSWDGQYPSYSKEW